MNVKLRVLKPDKNYVSYGVTIPKDIAIFFLNTTFTVKHEGTQIILTSGCTNNFIKQEARNYNFNDIRIKKD